VSLSFDAGPIAWPNPTSDSPIQDIVVLLGGWGGPIDGGDPLSETSTTGPGALLRRVKAIAPPVGHHLNVTAREGTLFKDTPIVEGLKFIRQNFHPRGKVIVYGYSAGGANALALCLEIGTQIPFFDITTNTFLNWTQVKRDPPPLPPAPLPPQTQGRVRVDLLITVDAARGPATDSVYRGVSLCVRRNVNYYQRTPSRIGSHGDPNQVDATMTEYVYEDWTGKAEHADIDEKTNDKAFVEIQNQLKG